MTNEELAKWIEDNKHSPSGYPDGSVIWRLHLRDDKIEQILSALRGETYESAMAREHGPDLNRER